MRFLSRLTFILSLLCGAVLCATAQTAQASGTGIITGRVTIGDKPARGVAIVLMPANDYGPYRKTAARDTTDADGRFRLTNLAAGRYEVIPIAPVFVTPESAQNFRGQNKMVNLNDSEAVEQIDFTLVRGGVITGRVTDADGRPVIGEHLRLKAAEQNNRRRLQFSFNPFLYETDDRGIYRIYGIPPGRYLVSVGEGGEDGMVRTGFGRSGFYPKTFHPGVAEETKAAVVEVTEGSEATNVDITLSRRAETFTASGQVVDAETGKPVPNVAAGYGLLRAGDNQVYSFMQGMRTDAEGRFRLEGLLPGRYAAFTEPEDQGDTYSVPAPFEISEGDVTGLVVKIRRGSSISGVAVIEGSSDRAVQAKLSQVRIGHWTESAALVTPTFRNGIMVNADGSFRINGVRAGKVRLFMNSWPPPKGLSLLRVERDGVEQRAGILEVPAGGEVTGVRLVFEYGAGVVRGQVRVENGQLPEDMHFYVTAHRPGTSETSLPGTEVDARGRFVLEGLPPGEYQLRLVGGRGPNGPRFQPVSQNVSVTNGVETQATLVIDLNAKGGTDK